MRIVISATGPSLDAEVDPVLAAASTSSLLTPRPWGSNPWRMPMLWLQERWNCHRPDDCQQRGRGGAHW